METSGEVYRSCYCSQAFCKKARDDRKKAGEGLEESKRMARKKKRVPVMKGGRAEEKVGPVVGSKVKRGVGEEAWKG